MPLVVPGVTNKTGDKTEEWQNKLVGKKLSDTDSNEVVRITPWPPPPNVFLIPSSLEMILGTQLTHSLRRALPNATFPRSTASLSPV